MAESFHNPHFDRIVGPEEDMVRHNDVVNKILDAHRSFGDQWIKEHEVKKTIVEQEVITLVYQEVSNLMKRWSKERVPTLEESRVHVLKEGGVYLETNKRFEGGAVSESGQIVVDRQQSIIKFALSLFHEMLHVLSYNSVKLNMRNHKIEVNNFRRGFEVFTSDGQTMYFTDIEEALIGYLTKQFYIGVLTKHPLFQDEVYEMEKDGIAIDTSRQEELYKLNKLVDALWEENHLQFESRDDIFGLFIDARINGNLLPIARLVEKTFGKGSFRKLGEGIIM